MAKPRLLTPEMQENMCALARKGLHQKAIAWRVGIGERTLLSWLDEDDQRHDEGFALAFRAAQSEAIEVLQNFAASDPAGARWLLEKMYPRVYRPDLFPEPEFPVSTGVDAMEELVNQRVAERLRELGARSGTN